MDIGDWFFFSMILGGPIGVCALAILVEIDAAKKEKERKKPMTDDLFRKTIDHGAITVSGNGAMSLDFGKFLELPEGRENMKKLAEDMKMTDDIPDDMPELKPEEYQNEICDILSRYGVKDIYSAETEITQLSDRFYTRPAPSEALEGLHAALEKNRPQYQRAMDWFKSENENFVGMNKDRPQKDAGCIIFEAAEAYLAALNGTGEK